MISNSNLQYCTNWNILSFWLLAKPTSSNIKMVSFPFHKLDSHITYEKWGMWNLCLQVITGKDCTLGLMKLDQHIISQCWQKCNWIGIPQIAGNLNTRALNTLRLRRHGCHSSDDIFKCIYLNENVWISIKISLNFVPKGPINNIPALVQTMTWHWPGDRPLSEPMMVDLLRHICVTMPRWVNSLRPSDAFMHQQSRPSLVQIMACRLASSKPLSEPMLEYY